MVPSSLDTLQVVHPARAVRSGCCEREAARLLADCGRHQAQAHALLACARWAHQPNRPSAAWMAPAASRITTAPSHMPALQGGSLC